MDLSHRRIAFVKVMLAAAWADGELTSNEIRSITDYLQRLRINSDEYQQIKGFLETPLNPLEARELLDSQLSILASTEEKSTLMAAVKDMLLDQDELHPEAEQFLGKITDAAGTKNTADLFVEKMRDIWHSPPSQSDSKSKKRVNLHAFLQKRVLEYYRQKLALVRAKEGRSDIDEVSNENLYKVIIWATLLGRVAMADKSFCPKERERLVNLLALNQELEKSDIEVIVDTYDESGLAGLDLAILVKEFKKISQQKDTSQLLDGLFCVAAADGDLKESECKIIRQISLRAGFTDTAFVNAMNRCRGRLTDGWN